MRVAFSHKADIGGVGGHIAPHPVVLGTVTDYLLRDTDRYACGAIFARNDDGSIGPQIVSFSTSKLHNIAQGYVGKDDPA